MKSYSLAQISDIVNRRPNARRIVAGQRLNKKMLMHLHGVGMKGSLAKIKNFEYDDDLYNIRKQYAMSNVDVFARLLQEEKQVFTARGGSISFGLPKAQETQMRIAISDVVYGKSLRKWIEEFGINAFRCDPMGVIFFEIDRPQDYEGAEDVEAGAQPENEKPKCYPVYKPTSQIWDYKNDGQQLEYICFILTNDELVEYGIQEPQTSNDITALQNKRTEALKQQQYFRFVDGSKDIIIKREGIVCVELQLKNGFQNPIKNTWGYVPGFVVSNIIKFSDPGSMDTPLNAVVELADTFLKDRSVRDLQKLLHGFAKAVEPIVTCGTCLGEGITAGKACPNCSQPGQERGSGKEMRTTIGKSLKLPLEILNQDQAPRFNFKNIFGYVTPDIESWDKQDLSLEMLYQVMYKVIWGCAEVTQPQQTGKQQDQQKTATEVVTNLQPKYSHMNFIADWAERTENMMANILGHYVTGKPIESQINLSRNYIFESPETIIQRYYDMCKSPSPDSARDELYMRYVACLYNDNPTMAQVLEKKFMVEPFPHNGSGEVEASPITLVEDKICKRYFGEWSGTLDVNAWTAQDIKTLKASLLVFAKAKAVILKTELPEEETEIGNAA